MPIAAHTAPHVAQFTHETPLGPALIARSAKGLTGLWFDGQKDHPGELKGVPIVKDDPVIQACMTQLDEYWRGQRTSFELPLDLHGTPFQLATWQALLDIEQGQLVSYGQLAQQLGRPQASRAIGAAVGMNPISVIVPCHRVVGSQCQLTGYAGGLDRKVALLEREGLHIQGTRVHPPLTHPVLL